MSGVVILANVPGGAWPETTVPVTLSGVQGAYNVVVVSGGVTIARLRAE